MTHEPPASVEREGVLSGRYSKMQPKSDREHQWHQLCVELLRIISEQNGGLKGAVDTMDALHRAATAASERLAALSTPPARPGREEIARIIQPYANWDGSGFDDGQCKYDRECALTNADQILALFDGARAVSGVDLIKLADSIAAYVEDAKRPIQRCDLSTWPHSITQGPDHRVTSLCNALTAIEHALRATQETPDAG